MGHPPKMGQGRDRRKAEASSSILERPGGHGDHAQGSGGPAGESKEDHWISGQDTGLSRCDSFYGRPQIRVPHHGDPGPKIVEGINGQELVRSSKCRLGVRPKQLLQERLVREPWPVPSHRLEKLSMGDELETTFVHPVSVEALGGTVSRWTGVLTIPARISMR